MTSEFIGGSRRITRLEAEVRRRLDRIVEKGLPVVIGAAATVGLMLWDGQSRGTLMNVLRLADRNKLVVVYVQPRKSFVDVRTHSDLSALLAELDRETAKRLHADAAAEGLAQGVADQPALF